MAVVDLHLHSTASDGTEAPANVVRRAADAGLSAIALTDHDTLGGVEEAVAAGASIGLRVVPGCEFSVAARWGEMHLLAYQLPLSSPTLDPFLADQRERRRLRAIEIVRRLHRAGIAVTMDDVMREANAGAVGRPHVARALLAREVVPDMQAAFSKYLGPGRVAFVPKQLPGVAVVTELVRSVGGVTSAAHLKERAVRAVLLELKRQGVDGVEAVHPSHDALSASSIAALARDCGLLTTGGSDWHGVVDGEERVPLGSMNVPAAWLEQLDAVAASRAPTQSGG